jgi:hypothetical protein
MVQPSVALALYPVLMCAAASQGELYAMESMIAVTGPLVHDSDGRCEWRLMSCLLPA